jgi:hypothetical protein
MTGVINKIFKRRERNYLEATAIELLQKAYKTRTEIMSHQTTDLTKPPALACVQTSTSYFVSLFLDP